jgi:probable phosphoglycerate mutase
LVILVSVNWKGDERTLWLVRHGESTWNLQGRIQGHADGPMLTEEGARQSAQVADGFQIGEVEAIYASDLTRAQQTATIVGAALRLNVQTHQALRERCFGVYEGLPLDSLESTDSGISGDRIVDTEARPEGGESLEDLYRRVGAFVDWLWEQPHAGDVMVVTHGGTIRALRAYCAGSPMAESAWDTVANGSVWEIRRAATREPSTC